MINQPFNLQAFMSGKPVRTKDGKSVQFVALLSESTPARLLVAIKTVERSSVKQKTLDNKKKAVESIGKMDNYYINGQWLPDVQSTVDLVMDNLF